jgi:AcrR family transcriptional regulator
MTQTRDPERSRAAILDAAEVVFAEHGFAAAGLQEIADRAGVSRATPSYFFGSKEGLYHAVLARAFARVQARLAAAQAEAATGRSEPEAAITAGIAPYLAFLIANPTFVRLVQWEAVTGGHVLREFAPHLAVVREQLALTESALARGAIRPVDPADLLISLVALCWFPAAHADTLLAVLGIDPRDPAFVTRYARHVRELVLHGIAATDAGISSTPAAPATP